MTKLTLKLTNEQTTMVVTLFAIPTRNLPLVEEAGQVREIRHLVAPVSALVHVQSLEHVVVLGGATVAHVLQAPVAQEQAVRVEPRLAHGTVHFVKKV